MNIIRYVRRAGRLECESITEKPNATLTELRFPEKLKGSLKLFDTVKILDGKSCIFDTSRLEDGLYFPVIYLENAIIEPEGFEILKARLKLIPKTDAYIRTLAAEIEALRCEIKKIKDELSRHDEKINGHPIF